MDAGFRVIGIDNQPQPRYIGNGFIQMDALEFLRRYLAGEFEPAAAFHASPPCQWITFAAIQWRKRGRQYPDLVGPTRNLLQQTGRPYIIEQPVGQVLVNPLKLNGAMFGLRVKRDRYFETSFPLPFVLLPTEETPRRMERPWDARKGELFYPVGHFSGVAAARVAMGLPWMTGKELSQAIPPCYTFHVGLELRKFLQSGLLEDAGMSAPAPQ